MNRAPVVSAIARQPSPPARSASRRPVAPSEPEEDQPLSARFACPTCGQKYYVPKDVELHCGKRPDPGFAKGDRVAHVRSQIVGTAEIITSDHQSFFLVVGRGNQRSRRLFRIFDPESGKKFWQPADPATVAAASRD